MKGLVLSTLGRAEPALELARRGLRANLRSHVCWHVLGLLRRGERAYDEAIRCYKNALRLEPDNPTVLRDLAQLQAQTRDLPGLLESRQALLEAAPKVRANWVSYALAHHLCGNHAVAAAALGGLGGGAGGGPGAPPANAAEAYEASEIVLYRAAVLEEGGLRAEALAALDEGARRGAVRDARGAAAARARLLAALGREGEAAAAYRELLDAAPEDYRWHDGLRAARGLPPTGHGARARAAPGGGAPPPRAPPPDAAQAAALAELYAELAARHPRSAAVARAPLDFLGGAAFAAAADAYVRRPLARGVPSLFADLRPLYADAAKAAALGEVLTRIEAALATSGAFPPLLGGGSAPPDGGVAVPAGAEGEAAPLTWARLFLARHHALLGDTRAALAAADACAAAAPGLPEALSARAWALKRAGDPAGAADAADAARRLDVADRFVAIAAAKAAFRAGRLAEGETLSVLFVRDGDAAAGLLDMQAIWYELASGRALAAVGARGRALKRLLRVEEHFGDFVEDQFDFHQYCARKQ
jgi:peptide alpha-N-acetyltransferase